MQRGQLRWRPNAAGATAVEAECGGGRMQWGTAVVEVGFVLMGYPGFTSPLLRFHFLA